MKIASNPWKTLGSRIVYEDRFIKIQEDDVVTPDGTQGKFSILLAPWGAGNGSQIIPVNRKGEIYFVGLWRYPTGRYSIELPGGARDAGETAIEAGKRELLEETGLTSSKWESIGSVDTLNWRAPAVSEVLLAEEVEEVAGRHDTMVEMAHEGISNVIKLSLKEVLILISERRITHSITIASLFLYVSHKGLLEKSK